MDSKYHSQLNRTKIIRAGLFSVLVPTLIVGVIGNFLIANIGWCFLFPKEPTLPVLLPCPQWNEFAKFLPEEDTLSIILTVIWISLFLATLIAALYYIRRKYNATGAEMFITAFLATGIFANLFSNSMVPEYDFLRSYIFVLITQSVASIFPASVAITLALSTILFALFLATTIFLPFWLVAKLHPSGSKLIYCIPSLVCVLVIIGSVTSIDVSPAQLNPGSGLRYALEKGEGVLDACADERKFHPNICATLAAIAEHNSSHCDYLLPWEDDGESLDIKHCKTLASGNKTELLNIGCDSIDYYGYPGCWASLGIYLKDVSICEKDENFQELCEKYVEYAPAKRLLDENW